MVTKIIKMIKIYKKILKKTILHKKEIVHLKNTALTLIKKLKKEELIL